MRKAAAAAGDRSHDRGAPRRRAAGARGAPRTRQPGMKRRMPRPSELAPLIGFQQAPARPRRRRGSRRALTIEDLRRLAKRRTPKAAFDYTDGAAEDELSLGRARQAFRDIEFHPTILRDVADGRHQPRRCSVRSRRAAVRHRADGLHPADAHRGRARRGPRCGHGQAFRSRCRRWAPRRSRTSAPRIPHGRNWFQLYMWKDRDRSMALVERAAAAGFDTLLVTVDVPVAGARLRDTRNGMSIPPTLTARTVLDAVPHPRWWFDLLTTEPLSFASLDRWPGTVAEYLDTMFDPDGHLRRPGVDQVAVAEQVGGQGHSDARRCQCGRRPRCRRLVLSNHGGRQLDRAPGAVPPAADRRAGARRLVRDFAGHRHHVRRRHRRRHRARRAVHVGRAAPTSTG